VAAPDTRPALPPGMISGLLFFGVVIVGSGYIIISKLNDFGALAVTSVPVLIMVGYAVLLGARLFRLRDDQAGDNLYYMGFLFTLTSLAVSLYQFSAAGSAEQIVQNFGIAIASTIAGITLRILFNQMRRDPVEVEATARMELAEASRRVKRELESVMLEFGYFRRATQQSVTDAFDEAQESIGKAHKDFSGELKKLSSKRSEQTLDGLNERTVQVLDVSRQLVREGEQLAKSTAKIVGAIDSLFVKLASRQTPEQIIQSELAPLIQSLTQALNSLHSSVETQAKNTEVNLEHAQSVVTAVNQLLQEIHAAEAPRLPAPRPRQVANDEP
jgi:methyl-accepting chemotaxis protein